MRSVIKPVAPKGYRILTELDLTLPLPPRTLCAAYPFDNWEPSVLVGDIVIDTVHAYAAPLVDGKAPTCAEISNLLPSTFYADRPPLERIALMVHGWRAALNALHSLEAERDELLRRLNE